MATQWTAQGITSGAVLPAATLQSIGAASVSYTPTLTQGVTVSKTISVARYWQFNKMIIGQVALGITSSGTAGQPVLIGLPISGNAYVSIITGTFMFTGGPSHYGNKVGSSVMYGLTTIGGFVQDGISNWFGVNPAFQVLNGDGVYATFMYEVV
jgi:hypothetical protein